MSNKNPTQEDVRKAWSEKAGKVDQYDLHEIETGDGESQTQLIDKDTGSITVAVNGTGAKALNKLFEHAGETFIDGGESPVESTGAKSIKRYTSRGVLATPTQPEVQIDTQEPVEVSNEAGNEKQAKAPVDRQASQGSVQLDGKGGEKNLKGSSVEADKKPVETDKDREDRLAKAKEEKEGKKGQGN